MNFDLDKEISRKDSNSVKWEFLHEGEKLVYGDHADPKHGKDRVLPLWVADMDFRCPPAVIKAMEARVKHGIFGYSAPTDSYFNAVINWFERRYDRAMEKEWIVTTPGVVSALYMLIQTFTNPGDKVLIQRPVYHPFFMGIESNGRKVVSNTLVMSNGRYKMDFDDLAAKAADPDVKMALLCSPHNPVGRVWNAEELRRFGEICLENDVLVISDEIHCDLIFKGVPFTSFANISETFAQKSIVCTAPSKTFNLAGLKTSNIIIPDQEMREQFQATMKRNGIWGTVSLGLVATEAAYNHGEAWLDAVMAYIEANYQFMDAFIKEHLPQFALTKQEGSYLVWLDCRALEMDNDTREAFFMEEMKLFVNSGETFGVEGEGFERFNLACPRSILAEALGRLKTAVSTLTIAAD
ncbi:MAG: pyridoxal phosphate-dependent aminotransferase [Chloroflexi bacterium]|nr:pyridoxal phosphate-dependent aminotransferase [Chloroflexota bacterium]